MARRTIGQEITGFLTGTLGLALIALALLIMLVRAYPLQFAVLAAGVVGGVVLLRRRAAHRSLLERERAERCAERLMDKHRRTLISYFRQSIRPAPFGGEDDRLWLRHVATFLERQVRPSLSSMSVPWSSGLEAHLTSHVDAWVRSANDEDRSAEDPVDPGLLTAIDYEQHCASILAQGGWTVQPTPVTGDRGADVVAEKNGWRLVVQCKLYDRPVGNSAVQEVYSARPLYHADHACVVAPRGYTAQAERDAHVLGVRLLHHSELAAFASGHGAPPSL